MGGCLADDVRDTSLLDRARSNEDGKKSLQRSVRARVSVKTGVKEKSRGFVAHLEPRMADVAAELVSLGRRVLLNVGLDVVPLDEEDASLEKMRWNTESDRTGGVHARSVQNTGAGDRVVELLTSLRNLSKSKISLILIIEDP